MSGGRWQYYNDMLAHELLGYNLDVGCGLEGEKHDYNLKDAIYLNPMNDPEVSGLVYDVFCLLHSFDWVVSGDTDEDDYRKDVAAFKKRWFKKARAEQVRAIIDICTDNLKEDLCKVFGRELNSELQLELWDDEKTATFRSDPMVVARINPQYTERNFVVTHESVVAFDAAMHWSAQENAPLLYVYGDRNVGKTHLLHAVARRALQRTPGLELLLRTGDWFFNEMICAIREGDLEARFAEYCNIEMLLLDNVQFAVYPIMANRFLQLLRSRNETGKRTILTADRPPDELLPELAPLIGQVVVLGRNIK